jgi:Cu-Zn family superoxide dismutase
MEEHMNRTLRMTATAGAVALVALLTPACQRPGEEEAAEASAETAPAAPARVAIAQLEPLGGSGVRGRVVFTEGDDDVAVEVDVTGLTPGGHGFHVHEYGDCSAPDGGSAGGHFNPSAHPHAGLEDAASHAGDLGNLTADEQGRAARSFEVSKLTLRDGPMGVLGRAVIVHAQADDFMTQPTGAAGGRIACGVIALEGGATEPVLAE